MKKTTHHIHHSLLLSLIVSTFSVGGTYIIPPKWDNTVNAVESKADVLITNLLTLESTNSYTISGKSLKYKCVKVPKIQCGNGFTPQLKATINGTPTLREPNTDGLISGFQTDVQVEDDGDKFKVCGGAVGGIVWDESTLEDDEKAGTITYTYIPTKYNFTYYFFTNATGTLDEDGRNGGDIKGSSNSFMKVSTSQMCR